MKTGIHADKCLSFISCDVNPELKRRLAHTKLQPAVTISRQAGAGAKTIAAELAEFLQARTPEHCLWAVFDKNLVEKVLEEHKLPKEVAKFMLEGRVSVIQDAVEEMLGLHPSSRTLHEQTSETILHLAHLGHVILIGRGANIVTREMKNVFHVRLIAPLENRVEQVMAHEHLDHKAAQEFIHKSDRGRQRYLQDHFHADIDDSLQYDLVINTARFPQCKVAHLIGEAVMQWAETL
ncbi:MAG: cytidylate kinase-like family protein [Verrucomicrobiota bacterium]